MFAVVVVAAFYFNKFRMEKKIEIGIINKKKRYLNEK
jgi:hypothetical protein